MDSYSHHQHHITFFHIYVCVCVCVCVDQYSEVSNKGIYVNFSFQSSYFVWESGVCLIPISFLLTLNIEASEYLVIQSLSLLDDWRNTHNYKGVEGRRMFLVQFR
jgi:hypothetical protein